MILTAIAQVAPSVKIPNFAFSVQKVRHPTEHFRRRVFSNDFQNNEECSTYSPSSRAYVRESC